MPSHNFLNRREDIQIKSQVCQNIYLDKSQAVEPCTDAQTLFKWD